MYSIYNKGKSVIAKRFIKTLKAKIYKKMTANDNKSYFSYLNKLVGQDDTTYHHSIGKKPINVDYSALTEKIETDPKAPKFKLMIESELLSMGAFLVRVTLKIGQEKYLLSILLWKLILGHIKLRI